MKVVRSSHRQQGAVIVTVALMLLFFLGLGGIALDFGRLFIVKTELQTAMDSCALAAAQELDASSTALTRATSAGITAGNQNNFNFQRSSVALTDADVTFSDTLTGAYSRGIDPALAKYAQCTQQKSGIAPWLLQAFGAFSGDATSGQAKSVAAMAVAARVPSQTNCLLPVGVCQKPGGFVRGEWIEGVRSPNDAIGPGQFGWLEFTSNDGTFRGASGISELIAGNGMCNLPGLKTEVEPGQKAGAEAAWNSRFGIYEGNYRNADPRPVPDETGYAWYWDGPAATAPRGRYDAPQGFTYHRTQRTPYNSAELPMRFNGAVIATDLSRGSSRRIISTGVLDCSVPTDLKLVAFGCFLMLNPVDTPSRKMWLEYLGDAAAEAGNPCATAGLPGGNSGVRVPALVQ